MGLDMFLFGIKKDKKDITEPSSGTWEEVCYWRKANQIHQWFNLNFIDKQNPWGYYEVDEENLQGLLLICKLLKHIKENPDIDFLQPIKTELKQYYDQSHKYDYADFIAYSLLPPQNIGCFFGSGEVDELYWEQIDDTIEQLTEALKGGYTNFFYLSSW